MNLLEIALFKRYTHNKCLDKRFIGSYRSKERIPSNPESLEAYLLMADYRNVYMAAFYFIINSSNGYDFWETYQKGFIAIVEGHEDNTEDNLMRFTGVFKYLKQNWDAADYWKSETKGETARRCGIKIADLIRYEHDAAISAAANRLGVSKDEVRNVIKDDAKPVVVEKMVCSEEDVAKMRNQEEEYDPLADFEFANLVVKKEGARKLKDNEITYNIKNKGSRIVFNQTVSKEIKARGGYEYATVGKNKKGEVILMLNDGHGVPMQDNNKENATIGSKPLCQKLAEYLDIKELYVVLKIKEIARKSDYVAYLVTK